MVEIETIIDLLDEATSLHNSLNRRLDLKPNEIHLFESITNTLIGLLEIEEYYSIKRYLEIKDIDVSKEDIKRLHNLCDVVVRSEGLFCIGVDKVGADEEYLWPLHIIKSAFDNLITSKISKDSN